MALPFEIQIGRVSRFLSKWASTKGTSPRVTLGSEVIPILQMPSGVENRFLDSWNRFAFQLGAAGGGAGNFSKIRIRNPAGSGVIAVFERIVMSSAGALGDQPLLSIGTIATNLGTLQAFTRFAVDGRGSPQSSLIISNEANTVGQTIPTAATFQVSFGPSGTGDFILDDNQELSLSPGDALQVSSNVANQATSMSFLWRERGLEESERQ